MGVRRREKVQCRNLRGVGDDRKWGAMGTKRLLPESGVAQFHFFDPLSLLIRKNLSF
jgi:hypothetical protein